MRRVLAPALLGSALVACNLIVGYNDLERDPNPAAVSGGDDDDDGGPTVSKSDGGSSGTSGSSGTVDSGGPRCDPTKPFGAPVALKGPVSSGSSDGPATFVGDELTMIFQRSTEPSSGEFLLARRTSPDADFTDEPTKITELFSGDVGFAPSMTADGLNIFWTQRVGSTEARIFRATRKTKNLLFEGAAVLDVLNTGFDDNGPAAAHDGSELIFTSNRGGDDAHPRLYHSVRSNGGVYQAPQPLTELNSPIADSREDRAALSGDSLTVYFSSRRADTLGGVDIYSATRTSKTAPFENIQIVPNINSTDFDLPSWVSPDHCRLYMIRLGANPGDILVASRP